MGDRHDVETAFKLLDIIQGHPGYTINCYRCGEPITDNLGITLDTTMGYTGDSLGVRHNSPPWDDCPIYMAKVMEEHRARMKELYAKYRPDQETIDFLTWGV